MALTNKNGLTPGQLTLQKEIIDRFSALEAQNATLETHIFELKKMQQTFQKENTDTHSRALENLKTGNDQINVDVSYYGHTITQKIENHQHSLKSLVYFVLLLMGLNIFFTYTTIKASRQARDGVYTINELLRGDTSFWYDADNHQLYVRDRNDTGQ